MTISKYVGLHRKAARSMTLTCLAAACCFASGVSYADSSSTDSTTSTTSPTANHGWTNNPFHPAYDHPWRHGVMPTREVHQSMLEWNDEFNHPGAATAQPTGSQGKLSFGGGVGGVGVLSGQSKVYVVFYGTQWGTQSTDSNGNLTFSGDSFGAAAKAQMMFKGIGTNSELWSAELTQWCDGPNVANGATTCPSNAAFIPYQQNIFAGAWYDNSAASPAGATAAQLANEAIKAAQHFGNTTAASNRYTYYIILSPHGTNPDNYQSTTQGYCAWHDYTADAGVTSPYGELAFSNQPYNMDVGSSCGVNFVNSGTAGQLDGYTMTLGHEWHEMMSDQFPAGGWTNHTGGTYNGQENSDECAWIPAGQAGGAANIAFSTGTFTEQASWSNDTSACAISHPIVGGGGGNSPPTANFSFTTSGLVANFTDSSTDSDGTIASRSWNFGDSSTSTSTNPSHTYAAAGTYTVTETVTDNGGATGTTSKSVTVTSTTTNVLTNGVPVTGLAATTGNKVNYTMAVPAGATNLKFVISGGTGDADLYVKFGSAPTTTSYDCRPFVTGNAETCTMSPIQAGTYYVMLNAYASFTGVTLTGSYTAPGSGGTPTANFTFSTSGLVATFTDTSTDAGGTIGTHSWNFGDSTTSTTTSPSHTYAAAGTYSVSETVTDSASGSSNTKTSSVTVTSTGGNVLTNGVPVTGLSGTSGTLSADYTLTVPSGKTSVTIKISGGTGDADLYARLSSAPTLTAYDCRPFITGNSETCTFTPPAGGGTYHVKLNAYATYSGVSLTGSYSP